jgi:hypothetical protein
MAAQLFIRWSRLGVWQRLLELTRAHSVELGMAFLDGTAIRTHAKAAGARKRGSGPEARRAHGLAALASLRPEESTPSQPS